MLDFISHVDVAKKLSDKLCYNLLVSLCFRQELKVSLSFMLQQQSAGEAHSVYSAGLTAPGGRGGPSGP